MDTSFGLKHVKSQGTVANNGGPETKCHWNENQPMRTSRGRKGTARWGRNDPKELDTVQQVGGHVALSINK